MFGFALENVSDPEEGYLGDEDESEAWGVGIFSLRGT